jgi:hypothetical protein
LIVVAFSIVIILLVEDALSTSPPRSIDRTGHALICGSRSSGSRQSPSPGRRSGSPTSPTA